MTVLKGFSFKDLIPQAPAIAEASTGLTMGQSAEKMAKENHITREAQDEFAHRSHALAAKAWAEGIYEKDVEDWVERRPEILGEELLVIGRQVSLDEGRDIIDLLAIDKPGNLVVVELKRDLIGGDGGHESRW